MPEITDTTPREQYTIAEETFAIPQPYTAGHALTAGEASQLNQVFAENARNNFAKKVKDAKEAGTFDVQVFQGQLDDYLNEYEMGVRTGGGRTGDPVRAEAMNIARDQVRKALIKKGHKLSDVPAKKISELAASFLSRGDAKSEQIMAIARQRVEATKEIADLELGDISADEPEAAAAEGEAAAPKARKGAVAEA